MLEALEYYQSLAQKFPGKLLTGPGVVVVLIGLCIWLAGLRWRRIVGAFVGAATAAVGVFVSGKLLEQVLLPACIIGLFVGIVINRLVFGIFGGAAAALIIMIVLSVSPPTTEVAADDFIWNNSYPTLPEYEQDDAKINSQQALQFTSQMAEFLIRKIESMIASSSIVVFAAAGLIVIFAVACALIVPRLFIAAVSSMLGSVIIFAGMIMLLFYKGSRPISCIVERSSFFISAFAAMIIFGTLVQLILSPPAKSKVIADEIKGDEK
jgi:hypothetical protein